MALLGAKADIWIKWLIRTTDITFLVVVGFFLFYLNKIHQISNKICCAWLNVKYLGWGHFPCFLSSMHCALKWNVHKLAELFKMAKTDGDATTPAAQRLAPQRPEKNLHCWPVTHSFTLCVCVWDILRFVMITQTADQRRLLPSTSTAACLTRSQWKLHARPIHTMPIFSTNIRL